MNSVYLFDKLRAERNDSHVIFIALASNIREEILVSIRAGYDNKIGAVFGILRKSGD